MSATTDGESSHWSAGLVCMVVSANTTQNSFSDGDGTSVSAAVVSSSGIEWLHCCFYANISAAVLWSIFYLAKAVVPC